MQLSRIDEILRLRREAAERYQYILGGVDGVRLPLMEVPGATISWFVYVVRVDERRRDGIIEAMAQQGIATSKYFAPIHWTKMWRSDVKLPVTERVAGEVLALPFFNQITKAQQERVCTALRAAL